MTDWRYIAQNILTGEFLHKEVPLTRDELTWDLRGPGALRATLPSDAKGSLLKIFEPLTTAIYVEADNRLRWGGILQSRTAAGSRLGIECTGFSDYPNGVPYTGPYYRKFNYPPGIIFRDIWDHMQAQPDGDLGVRIEFQGDIPVRVGEDMIPAYREYLLGGQWVRNPRDSDIIRNRTAALRTSIKATDTTFAIKTMAGFDTISLPFTVTIGTEKLRVLTRNGGAFSCTRAYAGTKAAAHGAGTQVKFLDGTPTRIIEAVEAAPYELRPEEAPDCGTELNDLAAETPFDWVEEHAWIGDTEEIDHVITVAYPRLGRKRDDLAFISGENVTNVITVSRSGQGFANSVFALGAGEGNSMVRTEVHQRDGRLRRPYVHTNKLASNKSRLTNEARKQLMMRQGTKQEITSITVRDHAHARMHSWRVGDDILIQAELPWEGSVAIWHRVISWTMVTETTATLSLVRSDSFNYGGS